MKRHLALAAGAAFSTLAFIAYAQQTGGQPLNPAPASASPSPSTAGPDQPGGAASSVPLPAQAIPTASPAGPALPLMQETNPQGGPGAAEETGGKAGEGEKSKRGLKPGAHGLATPPKQTFDVEQDIRLRVHIRQAGTKAVNQPDLEAEWVAVHQTVTDPERRTALINYYNHLYDRMIKLDPTIATAVNVRRQGVINRMHYARLGDLLPAEDPYATPTPAAEGANPPNADEPPSL